MSVHSALTRVVTVANGKGGVGKSTVATNVAGLAAAAGWRVLLVDFDPQGNAGHILGYGWRGESDGGRHLVQALVAGTPGVEGVRLQSLVLGGESVLEIVSSVPLSDLRYALDTRGLRLESGSLRRRGAGEAALPPPAPEVQEEQLQESPGPQGGA